MIASYSNNFIFIKTRKTGGTSAEIVLSSWCSGRDICIPITAEDELLRRSYGGGPLNFCEDPELEQAYNNAIDTGNADTIDIAYRALRPRLRFRNHDSAEKMQHAMPELWSSAFTFAIDRHPYEKVVSLVYWRIARRRDGDTGTFDDTLDEVLAMGDYVNYPLYMAGGRPLVDAVFRYQEMWNEIRALGDRLGHHMPENLPRAKSGHRADYRPASESLRPEHKTIIRKACAPEFELLGWPE